MIVLERQRLVILTPAKTGSAALHRSLVGPPANGHPVYTVDPSGEISKHGVHVPLEFRSMEYRVAVVVRNPYDRLISQFTHYGNWRTSQGLSAPSLLDFLTTPPDHLVFGWSLTRSLEGATWDDVWHLETLNEHLQAVGLPDVEPYNQTWHLPTTTLLTQELRKLADTLTEADRHAFGYLGDDS